MENNAQNLKVYRLNALNAKIEKESLEFERDAISQIKKKRLKIIQLLLDFI